MEFDGKVPVSPYTQFNPMSNALYGGYTFAPLIGGLLQFEYTGWREEMLSWHENCYIHAGLNPFPECKIVGPDLIPFLSYNFTNGFNKFPVGSIRHGMVVNERGTLMADGLVIRTAEDEVECTCMPILAYRIAQQDFDVEYVELMGTTFFYQLGGPRSLEVIEAACEEDFHDLGFLKHRMAKIAGAEVRIQRIGMAGALAYEIHGQVQDCQAVYAKVLEVGKEFDLHELGRHAYWNTHTENGFPQGSIHFPMAYEQDDAFWKHALETGDVSVTIAASSANLRGSVGQEIEPRFVNPFEPGWGRSVNFDHDFIGKEALQKIYESGDYRRVVTLEWNVDDVLDVWRSGLVDGEPYCPMDDAEDFDPTGKLEYRADKVLADGKMVGISAGRIHSWYYQRMLSLGFVAPEYAKEGTELVVLWGDEGTRQKEIRAKVVRYPYMDTDRNEDIDVMASIPRRFA